MNRVFHGFVFFLILIILLSACSFMPALSNSRNVENITFSVIPTFTIPSEYSCIPRNNKREIAKVIKVIDGDSILVEMDNQIIEVRYIGINAPEYDSPQEKDAILARERNNELVYGKTIWMVRDVRDKDQYKRLLRFVFVDGVFVNLELVKQGVARVQDYPPDISCQAFFRKNVP